MRMVWLAFIWLCLSSCNQALFTFKEKVRELGFIPYTLPVTEAGTGTIVGGTPNRLAIMAAPQTCFPGETLQELRRIDDVAVMQMQRTINVAGQVNVLLEWLQSGSPSIGLGYNFSRVEKVNMQIEGASLEYLDAVALAQHYPAMNTTCKRFMEHVGFVIQALRVEGMKFQFFSQDNQRIQLSVDNIEQYLTIGADVQWQITEDSTLEIKSPKYIGYQLARLQRKDEGFALYRAMADSRERFIYHYLGHFRLDPEHALVNNPFAPDLPKLRRALLWMVQPYLE
jgi:hypothetical protein